MPSLQVRDLPAPVLDGLKQRAKLHHRSLQGELHAILEDAARATLPAAEMKPLRLTLSTSRSTRPWHREEIYDDRAR
ncbi:MAG TPA: Arc family DNA-binding protein [Polyangia bacterium]|jgi:plasmid stability protein